MNMTAVIGLLIPFLGTALGGSIDLEPFDPGYGTGGKYGKVVLCSGIYRFLAGNSILVGFRYGDPAFTYACGESGRKKF